MMTRYRACLLAAALLHVGPAVAQEQLPIPPAEAQRESLTLIKEVYGQEWDEAKTPKERQALASRLLQRAKEPMEDDTRYMLLRVAQNLAAQAGDAELAFKAIEAMVAKYDVDAYRLKGSALSGAAKSATTEHSVTVATLSLALIDEAVDRDDFVAARFLGGLAVDTARKGRDFPLARQIVERNREVEEVAEAFAALENDLATLNSNPVDPDANLAVGKYHCFVKGNWDRGLPKLALGSDEELKGLAVKELKGVSDSDEQVALGDGWWDVAATVEGVAKGNLEGRARHWYQKALPGLSGLEKDRVDQKLKRRIQENTVGQGNSTPESAMNEPASKKVIRSGIDVTSEQAFRSQWTPSGEWRLEGQGVNLLSRGKIVSVAQFVGDLDVVIDYSASRRYSNHNPRITLFGISFGPKLGKHRLFIQRRGNQIAYAHGKDRPTVVMIKDSDVERPSVFEVYAGHRANFRIHWMTLAGEIDTP